MNKVCVFGFGYWGKALTKVLCVAGNDVMIYTRQDCQDLERIYPQVSFSNDLSKVVKFSDVGVIASRASDVMGLVAQLKIDNLTIKSCIIGSKGFSNDGRLLSDVVGDIAHEIGVLVGPNFAHEIIDNKLTISTLGGNIPNVFSGKQFRVEKCNDIIGLQVCSIMKNIYAIGCGIVVAAFESENTKAAFLTMAFNELLIAIELFGGVHETAYTSGGLGDLVLTCYSINSRNHMFGEIFVRGEVDKSVTVEGYSSIIRIKDHLRAKLPICNVIYKLLSGQITIDEFKVDLMQF